MRARVAHPCHSCVTMDCGNEKGLPKFCILRPFGVGTLPSPIRGFSCDLIQDVHQPKAGKTAIPRLILQPQEAETGESRGSGSSASGIAEGWESWGIGPRVSPSDMNDETNIDACSPHTSLTGWGDLRECEGLGLFRPPTLKSLSQS